MSLSALTGPVVVALALVAGVTGFARGFVIFALLVLPVVLFAGVGTFRRLIEINREDVRWVVGMDRLRHASSAAPELRPYFVTAWTDDEAGIMTTFYGMLGFTQTYYQAKPYPCVGPLAPGPGPDRLL